MRITLHSFPSGTTAQSAAAALITAAIAVLAGCGPRGIQLVEAGGVVKYRGQPLAGATVMFVSEHGPPAMGVTNDAGEFQLNSQGRPGVAPGPYTISVVAQKDSREITPEEAQTITIEELNKIRKSLIPVRYSHPRTSGLSETVDEDPAANNFVLELSD